MLAIAADCCPGTAGMAPWAACLVLEQLVGSRWAVLTDCITLHYKTLEVLFSCGAVVCHDGFDVAAQVWVEAVCSVLLGFCDLRMRKVVWRVRRNRGAGVERSHFSL